MDNKCDFALMEVTLLDNGGSGRTAENTNVILLRVAINIGIV